MAERLAVKPVYDALWQHVRKRHDLGWGKTVLDAVLEPASPFDSKRRRSPKPWVLWSTMLAAAMLGCFMYFNSLR
jgi:hypothetical protein